MERNEKRLTIPQAKKMVATLQSLGHSAAFNRMGDGKMAVHIYENSDSRNSRPQSGVCQHSPADTEDDRRQTGEDIMATLTREQKKMALTPFATADDVKHDPFGVGMAHLFAIADTLSHVDSVPGEWEYRQGMGGDHVQDVIDCGARKNPQGWAHFDCDCEYAQIEYVSWLDAGELGIEMLTYAGNVINYVVDREQRAGRDY